MRAGALIFNEDALPAATVGVRDEDGGEGSTFVVEVEEVSVRGVMLGYRVKSRDGTAGGGVEVEVADVKSECNDGEEAE